jgi:hypothetical protein
MRLSFLKMESITESTTGFGKYVSENYLSLTKVTPWLISDLESYEANDVVYKDPNKDAAEYNKAEAAAWLKSRNIRFNSKMKKIDLLLLVDRTISDNDGVPPPISRVPRNNATVDQVTLLMHCMYCLNARVFVKGNISKEQGDDLDRHVKIFLFVVDRFDKETLKYKKDKTPVILKKINLITLAKLASDSETFGGLRLLYEGDGKCEGALPLKKKKN